MKKSNKNRLGKIVQTLRPGQNGTKKLQQEYGWRLVAARYHRNDKNRTSYKTVELIISRTPIKKKL